MNSAELLNLGDLAQAVNDWCHEHSVEPVSGQAAMTLNERSIRYYRTLGLIDPPEAGGAGRSYSEKHFLQLIAIRLLQAQGLPLRRIQELLYGRTLAELREVRRRGLQELPAKPKAGVGAFVPGESWQVLGLTPEFGLLSRSGAMLSPEQIEAIRRILTGHREPSSFSETPKNSPSL